MMNTRIAKFRADEGRRDTKSFFWVSSRNEYIILKQTTAYQFLRYRNRQRRVLCLSSYGEEDRDVNNAI
jgi:hypothetical protein